MNTLPRVRAGLLHHQFESQVLVYDPRDDRVHLLDPTTACVVELLREGGWTPESILAKLTERLGAPSDEGLLTLALEELRVAGLLDPSVPTPTPLEQGTRRELVRKLALTGAATMLVPAIATLTASAGYAQGSRLPLGSACSDNVQCESGRCCNGTCADAGCVPSSSPCSPVGLNCECCSGECRVNELCL